MATEPAEVNDLVGDLNEFGAVLDQLLREGTRGEEGTPDHSRLRSEVNNSLIIVNNFHKIQNFRQISDLFSQI